MPALQTLGTVAASGRSVHLLELGEVRDFAEAPALPSPRFVFLLAGDVDLVSVDELSDLAKALIRAGCAYFCAWGDGCARAHDVMDEVLVELELAADRSPLVMTTWHEHDSLEDAVSFALVWAEPDETLRDGCDAIVLATVGEPNRSEQLRRAAQGLLQHVI